MGNWFKTVFKIARATVTSRTTNTLIKGHQVILVTIVTRIFNTPRGWSLGLPKRFTKVIRVYQGSLTYIES
jgi:hypothetical protein